jgi:hypothetical protein
MGDKSAPEQRSGLARNSQPAGIPGGDGGTRTPDFHVANVALSQLSYIPFNSGYYKVSVRRWQDRCGRVPLGERGSRIPGPNHLRTGSAAIYKFPSMRHGPLQNAYG